MMFAVAFTTCLLLIFGVYGTREDGFTSDIDWNKLTGTWFLAVSTKFNYWDTLYKCHIIIPYNITDEGMQIYFYNIPVDSGSDASGPGVIEDVIFGPGGGYKAFHHITDEVSWFESHPVYFSTNYEVIIYKLKFPQGRMAMWIYTRNQGVSAAQAVELMNLAQKKGANVDLEVKGCGDIAPQQYFKQA